MSHELKLRRRIKTLTWIFIIGLFLSGATAIPLQTELRWLTGLTGADQLVAASAEAPAWALWLVRIRDSLLDTAAKYPFLFYGTDWLAFGHFVIALAFVGALRDPVRNRWLFEFGMIACVVLVPYAFVFGAVRGIPLWWGLIDCAFGVFGFVPLWFCWRWARELEGLAPGTSS
jgi:hypothetical protein